MFDLLNRRLVWVGGKGGVGKTTVSAALAVLAAERGKRCLIVSTDPAHSLGDVFARQLDDKPRRILPDLDAMEIDPDAEVDAHLRRVMQQMEGFAAPEMLGELRRQMQLTRQSPGTQEAALLERIARLINDPDSAYDLIIFDTAPIGHTLRLLSLPEAMAAWTDGLLSHNRKSAELGKVLQHLTPKAGRDIAGPFDDPGEDSLSRLDRRTRDIAQTLLDRRRLFHQARRKLEDPTVSGFLFVMTPERLPILETVRAVATLQEVGIPVVATLVNRVIPEDADGDFLRRRRAQEAVYLQRIDSELQQLPRPRLPWLETDVQGLDILQSLAGRLAALGF
ncbi:arsenical pump-driving ATPase [Pseudomonas saudimassiliensis]|uniref:arsenite-transporting ATPase n=1 Tax=Pseudomonas saudimassiliensis TaxID=1461581 RepID=A0A078MIS6_9PSED|nr:ArsA family ATPase [Pseudomonas saudimassiliensis]CEA05327.1 arsenical pump-driving ATPase [Pseudomonas saudimassiliensis]CEF27080.1 arsenical pump-driving ATPase [Pseudomonas saudimassiliensis]